MRRKKDITLKEHLASIAQDGGKAGRGKSKRRGDSEYYRRIARKRWKNRDAAHDE